MMRDETPEEKTRLRSGFTTGACATATSLAAADLLLNGRANETVTITLPKGRSVDFRLEECVLLNSARARASTIKDAGDDPDATHGATIFAEVGLSDEPGIRFHAGCGVGTVTRCGLSLGVGEAAINPVPRKMMTGHLEALAREQGYSGGFEVTIGVVDGQRIARDTMNARLGILGGISILGTTGIVRPYSCSAFIASIHQSIDVAHANGIQHIAAATGSTSEDYIQSALNLTDMAVVEMGDFAGAVFKRLRRVSMKKLSICGGFGKISKLAAGHQSLHSKDSSIDFGFLAEQAVKAGGDRELKEQIMNANTSLEALTRCQQANLPVADTICSLARQVALKATRQQCEIDVYTLNRNGALVGSASG